MSEGECCKSSRAPIYVLPDIRVIRLLVTGSRSFIHVQYLRRVLDAVHYKYNFRVLIHGGARGVDLLADQWAREHGVQPARCDALWSYYTSRGNMKAAGVIRNSAMLWLQPQLVLAFPGNTGTADMREKAREEGVPVVDLTEDFQQQ